MYKRQVHHRDPAILDDKMNGGEQGPDIAGIDGVNAVLVAKQLAHGDCSLEGWESRKGSPRSLPRRPSAVDCGSTPEIRAGRHGRT